MSTHQSPSSFRQEILSIVEESENRGLCEPGMGLAVSIVRKGDLVYEDAFGFRDRKNKLPITLRTVFAAGSIGKTFTSAAAMLLHERGLVDLDAPLNGRASFITLKDPAINRTLSPRDILCHRVGLPANDLLWLLSTLNKDELLYRLRHFDLIPNSYRASFAYNNLLYSAFAVPLEAVVRQSWPSFVAANLFEPLGMNSSTFDFKKAKSWTDVALPSGESPMAEWQNTDRIQAAGGLYLSLNDLTKWLKCHLPTKKTSALLLAPRSLELMRTVQSVVPLPAPFLLRGMDWLDEVSYGLGWFVARHHRHKVIFHPGSIEGFSSVLALIPSLGIGVAVLTNGHWTPVPGLIAQSVFCRLLGKKRPEGRLPLAAPPTSGGTSAKIPAFKRFDYSGKYYDPGFGLIEILGGRARPVLKYERHVWPLSFANATSANFAVDTFKLRLPLTVTFPDAKTASIPFSMDPRVAPRIFRRGP